MTELWHATCPGKRDIEPPKFVREEVIVTSRGELQTWRFDTVEQEAGYLAWLATWAGHWAYASQPRSTQK